MMFCRGSFWRWIILAVVIFWGLKSINLNLWPLLAPMVLLYILFKGDIYRLFRNLGTYAETSPPTKRKNHTHDDIQPNPNIHYGNDDGLNRRIIRASDGEILVAVEDPQTGMLYLEDQS